MSGVFKDGAYYPLGCGEEMSEGEYQASFHDGLWEDELSEHAQDARDFEDRQMDMETRRPKLESFLDGLFPSEWSIRDGRTLKIADMTTSHLDNAIRFFGRFDLDEHSKINELREERKRRS